MQKEALSSFQARRRPRRRRKPITGSERSPKKRSTAAGRRVEAGESAKARSARRRSMASDTGSVGSTPFFSSAASVSCAMVFLTWSGSMMARGVRQNPHTALRSTFTGAPQLAQLICWMRSRRLAHFLFAERAHEVLRAQELVIGDVAPVPLGAPVVREPRVALDVRASRPARANSAGTSARPSTVVVSFLCPRPRTPPAAASRRASSAEIPGRRTTGTGSDGTRRWSAGGRTAARTTARPWPIRRRPPGLKTRPAWTTRSGHS